MFGMQKILIDYRAIAANAGRDAAMACLVALTGLMTILPLIAIISYIINLMDGYGALGIIVGAPFAASLALCLALWLRPSTRDHAAH
jgi:uncharacterized membrane protein